MDEQVQGTAVEQEAPAAKKGAKAFFVDCYRNRTKRAVSLLCICVVLILLATLVGSMVQTAGWKVTVTELRNETNSGTKLLTAETGANADKETAYAVEGSVASGLLFVPKNATKATPAPGIVFCHGLYNNREMQLQNVIEMARRGFVVLVIDYEGHGHNTSQGQSFGFGAGAGFGFGPETFISAAKYLYNLDCVAKDKIAVSGHSMGGGATFNALALDGIDTAYSGEEAAAKSTDAYSKGIHMGIISAGLIQANNASVNVGSNVKAVGVIKASADEFFFACTLKEETYLLQAKDEVKENWDAMVASGLYVKKGNDYVQVKEGEKYSLVKNYYIYGGIGVIGGITTPFGTFGGEDHHQAGPSYYLQSKEALLFRGVKDTAALADWTTVNGGIYNFATGEKIAEPGKMSRTNVPIRDTLVSTQRKGDSLTKDGTSIRVIYQAAETHPMNHFSTASAGHVIDFFYNAFGRPENVRYLSPVNQTWWLKEVFSLFGFLGLFGMIIAVIDLLLGTKLFASLAAQEGDIAEAPALLRSPRKHVSYWLGGVLTAIFSAVSLRNMTSHGNWYSKLGLNKLFAAGEGYIFDNIGAIASWGVICTLFGVVVTALIWLVNHCINAFKHGDDAVLYDEQPFAGLKIRSWQNVLKTPLLAAIIYVIFYGVIGLIWSISLVDMRFWTFDLRVFDMIKLVSILKYVPFFFIFYLGTALFSQNYRVKDLPEWATIAINVFFNVIGYMVMIWICNSFFINNGAQYDSGNGLFFIACYPIIPCVAVATVLSRRIYVRTGNAWLAGLINALIMTTLACANTSISALPAWTYGA